jgi:hypothetical protein
VGKHGGGIEIGSGLTSSDNIAFAFRLPPGTAPAPSALGTNVVINNAGGTGGAVVSNTTSGGVVNLSLSGSLPAALNLQGGAIVIDAIGSQSGVELDGGSFSVEALRPIRHGYDADVHDKRAAAEDDQELIVDTGDCVEDESTLGPVTVMP